MHATERSVMASYSVSTRRKNSSDLIWCNIPNPSSITHPLQYLEVEIESL